jgi:hypothetical protein
MAILIGKYRLLNVKYQNANTGHMKLDKDKNITKKESMLKQVSPLATQ